LSQSFHRHSYAPADRDYFFAFLSFVIARYYWRFFDIFNTLLSAASRHFFFFSFFRIFRRQLMPMFRHRRVFERLR